MVFLRFALVGLFVALGGMLATAGYRQYAIGGGARQEPDPIALRELRDGHTPPSNYVRIGPHVRLCDEGVLIEAGEDDPQSPAVFYYPLASADTQTSSAQGTPTGDPSEKLQVLVRLDVEQSARELPGGSEAHASLQGLLAGRAENLPPRHLQMLRRKFPREDFRQVRLLRQNRAPWPASTCVWVMVAGGVTAVLPLVLLGAFILARR
jgi:hypothetical protein